MGHSADAVSRAMFGAARTKAPRRYAADGARATYDAAATTPGNKRHWANADALSAKAANNPQVRRTLRNRARLEFDNGGNCKGAIETIAHDTVGTGPRLQLSLPDGSHPDAAKVIEKKFRDWCDDPAVNFADKLRVMVESELRDGESFALFVSNEAVEGAVKFDFRVIEAEQVATPALDPLDPNAVDGIEFDAAGNAVRFHLLKVHPGDLIFNPIAGYTPIPARQMVHWFRPNRAGHVRGIPRITPGLPLMAQIRGYTSATLAAARMQAQYAAVLKTNQPAPDDEDAVAVYDDIPLNDAGAMTLPYGWDLVPFESNQPTSTHKEFRETNLTEFGRGIHCPKNVVTGDSSGMNFSSSRLDHLMYRGAMKIERNRLCVRVCDRIFRAWLAEAFAVRGYIPDAIWATLPPPQVWAWAWQFDGFPSINPVDDASANETNLRNGLVTHGELLAERGVDWREHFKSLAEQFDLATKLGIVPLLYPWMVKATVAGAQLSEQQQPAKPPPRTNEGTKGQPQDGLPPKQHGAEWQAERDTVLEDEVTYA